jgi:hypothetical protein
MKIILKQIISITMCFCSLVFFAADDIALTSAKINQLTLQYEKVQISQAQGVTFTGYLNNTANFDHTGIYLNLKVVDLNNDTIFDVNTSPVNIVALSEDSILITIPFNTPESGSYTFIFKMFQDIPDAIPSNNLFSTSIIVDDHIYQVDNGNAYGTSNLLTTTDQYEVGNMFEIYSPGELTAVSVFISPNTDIGTYVYAYLYEYDESSVYFSPMDQTFDYIIGPDDLGNTITMYFNGNAYLGSPGQYCIMVGTYGGLNFEIGTSQSAPDMTAFYNDLTNGFWYFSPSVPMVRLLFDQYQDVSEEAQFNWDMYPNPSNDFINFNLPIADINEVKVTNINGQVVLISSIGPSKHLDVSVLETGVYFVTIGSLTKKLIKK